MPARALQARQSQMLAEVDDNPHASSTVNSSIELETLVGRISRKQNAKQAKPAGQAEKNRVLLDGQSNWLTA